MIPDIAQFLEADNEMIKQLQYMVRLSPEEIDDLFVPAGMILMISYKLLQAQWAGPHKFFV